MLTKTGKHQLKIISVGFAEPRFETVPNAFDVVIEVESVEDPSITDHWRGEWSTKYGIGTVADKMQWELTLATLEKIGFQGQDLSTLSAQIVGKITTGTVVSRKNNDQTYYELKYLGGGGGGPKLIDPAEMMRRAAALSSAPSTATNPFAATQGASDDCPF